MSRSIEHRQPVRRDLYLRVRERQRAGADLIVEMVFDRIVLVEAGSRFRGFRPHVRKVVASAKLQAN